eukprot:477967-Pyramimonas_sp.AAC.1
MREQARRIEERRNERIAQLLKEAEAESEQQNGEDEDTGSGVVVGSCTAGVEVDAGPGGCQFRKRRKKADRSR